MEASGTQRSRIPPIKLLESIRAAWDDFNLGGDDHAQEATIKHPLTPEEMFETIAVPIETRADTRDQEDNMYVGGMRIPNRAVARNPATRAMGRRLRRVLEDIANDTRSRGEVDEAWSWLGNSKAKGFSDDVLDFALKKINEEFSAAPSRRTRTERATCRPQHGRRSSQQRATQNARL